MECGGYIFMAALTGGVVGWLLNDLWPSIASNFNVVEDHLGDGSDTDLNNRRAENGAGRWRNGDFCPHCHEEIGHNEFMTRICLSCGEKVRNSTDWRLGAVRNVRINGQRVPHLLLDEENYLRKGGRWIPADRYPTPPEEHSK